MNHLFPQSVSPRDQTQSRLMLLAAGFVCLYAAALTLAPAVRLHTWQAELRWAHWLGVAVWMSTFALLHRLLLRQLPDRDPYLLPAAALLTGWGLMTIWRLEPQFGLRQTLWLAVSGGVFALGLRLPDPLRLLRRYKYLWLTSGLLLTALTFFIGVYPSGVGPELWLGCCGVYLQPSEPLKLLLVVYLSAYLADALWLKFNWVSLLSPTLVLTGAALALLLAQRDLGTALIFLTLYFLILYLASGRARVMAAAVGVVLAAAVLGSLLFEVIQTRMAAWLNPWADPSGRSFQIVQSIMAVAAGSLMGSGPGLGSPGLVPVAHSDFIFAAIAEEMGLAGSLGLLAVVGLFVSRGLRAALHAPSNYQRYLAAGLSAYIGIQSILIIGGNLRALPLTGVTLPYVSYGGSSLLTSFIILLILILISSPAELEPAPLPKPTPYRLLALSIVGALTVLALGAGWWALVRAAPLSTRADNPRQAILDRFVGRGRLLDRAGLVLVADVGSPGSFRRQINVPSLSLVTGYAHPLYGLSGLEAALNPYLRGLQGVPTSEIQTNQMLYAQRPPGLDVRLSLDQSLQAEADRLLGEHRGALVLMNAQTGEILAMASHPYADFNRLDSDWDTWRQDPSAPLFNRAAQGTYPPGAAVSPFLLTAVAARGPLPALPGAFANRSNSAILECALPPTGDLNWEHVVSAGCPEAAAALEELLSPTAVSNLYRGLGWAEAPDLPLNVAVPPVQDAAQALQTASLRVSPLQMALAAASLSADGRTPAPRLAMAVNTPAEGWVILPSGPTREALPSQAVQELSARLALTDLPLWMSTARAASPEQTVTWGLGGTVARWQGSPLALAVVIEEDNPAAAARIVREMLQATLNPGGSPTQP